MGSLITYAWIGSHYTTKILARQKMSVRKLRLVVIKKFHIQVSLVQCRRAKKYAPTLIEGNLVEQEHYAKLWSYGVRIEANDMSDGKKYFNRFYVCFEGVIKGWMGL